VRTISKWRRRYRVEDELGLVDRSSAPARVPGRTPQERVQAIALLRRERLTAWEIAERLRMPLSTVSTVLRRIGLGRLSRLEPLEPPNRYQRERPGELVHIDVKKLGRIGRPGHRVNGDRRTRSRGVGWEYVHVAVDDATRLAYLEVLEDEKAVTAVAFLRRAVAHFGDYGIRVERVMTYNGSCYRAVVHALALPRARPPAPAHASLPAPHQASRPNDSSAPCSAAGPTAPSTRPQRNALGLCQPGSTSTISEDPTAASAAKHRPRASTRSGTTLLGPTSQVELGERAQRLLEGRDRIRVQLGAHGGVQPTKDLRGHRLEAASPCGDRVATGAGSWAARAGLPHGWG